MSTRMASKYEIEQAVATAREAGSKVFRRLLYFVKDLPIGHVIGPGYIRRIQPGMGLVPKYFDEVVGKTTTRSIVFVEAVKMEDFK